MPLMKKLLPSGATVLIGKCEVCGKYAAYGKNVDLIKNKGGQWYCGEHKDEVTTLSGRDYQFDEDGAEES